MQENKFEKNVQEQMEDLKFQPSASVWSGVEKELKRKKRRRVVVFAFLLAGLGLIGYSTFILSGTGGQPGLADEIKNPPAQNSSIPEYNEGPQVNQQAPGGSKHAPSQKEQPGITDKTNDIATIELDRVQEENQKMIDKGQPENALSNSSQNKKVKPASGDSNSLLGTNKPTGKVQKTANPAKTDQDNIAREKRIEEERITENVEPLVKNDKKKDEELPKRDPEAIASQKTEPGIAANDQVETRPSLTPGADSLSIQDSTKVQETLNETKMAKSKSRSKIKFFADVSAGAVFNRENAFAISTPRRPADYLVYYGSPIGTGSNVAGRVILGPSTVETGPAFKLGFMAEMELNARSSMIAGLRYAYLSDRIKAGQRRDTAIQSSSYQSNATTSINAIYSSTPQKAYTNQYHFIEIPVWYQLQLNRGKRVPILFNAGLSLSYLASTNGLVYDTAAGGVYYRNAGAYNKLHFNLQTGLHFRFGNKGKIQWSLGPEIAMDMRKLLKEDVFTEKRYFLYGGISGRFYLPRKK